MTSASGLLEARLGHIAAGRSLVLAAVAGTNHVVITPDTRIFVVQFAGTTGKPRLMRSGTYIGPNQQPVNKWAPAKRSAELIDIWWDGDPGPTRNSAPSVGLSHGPESTLLAMPQLDELGEFVDERPHRQRQPSAGTVG